MTKSVIATGEPQNAYILHRQITKVDSKIVFNWKDECSQEISKVYLM